MRAGSIASAALATDPLGGMGGGRREQRADAKEGMRRGEWGEGPEKEEADEKEGIRV